MDAPESPLSAAPTAPSSPSVFRLDDVDRAGEAGKVGRQEQEQEQEQKEEIDYFDEARKARQELYDEDVPLDDDGPPIVAVVFQTNGDVHMCRGSRCPHLQLNADNAYVCKLSGVVCGAKAVREDDSTGRMTGSCNPDDNAGGLNHGPRADAFAMSAKAFEEGERAVAIVDETQLFVAAKKKRKRRGDGEDGVKRGARCVDEEQDEHVAKATRRTASTTDEHQLLLREAEVVLSTLIAHTKKATTEEATIDPMLCDHRALFEAAAAKYLKTQQAAGQNCNLSELHDLALACARVASANRAKLRAQQERSGRAALLLKPAIRSKIVNLVVSVWLASCETTYMRLHSKNTESFRPAVSGILYGLKRGVQLPTGEFLVPACTELCEALPVLRGTEKNSAAKSLHAASHSGLRSLHRSIASCAAPEVHFADCVIQSKAIKEDCERGRFDL